MNIDEKINKIPYWRWMQTYTAILEQTAPRKKGMRLRKCQGRYTKV